MKKSSLFKRGVAFAFAVTIALSVCLTASAQKQFSTAVVTGLVIPSNTTTNLATPLFIDASKSQVLSFGMLSTASTVIASNTAWYLAPSVDGINMDTNNPVILNGNKIYTTGLAPFNYNCTNINVGAIQGYFLYQIIAPPDASTTSTNTLKFSQKLQAP